jgi:imidazolonepropionase-like amidohydrolase
LGPPAALGQAASSHAFVNVNVVLVDEARVLPAQTVVVADGRIAAVGPMAQVDVPAAAARLDAQGQYLVPGLAEMHAHVPGPGDPQYVEDVLFLYVANGVTTARGMLGQPQHLELRRRLADNDLVGPRLYTCGPSLRGESVDSPATAARLVREQAAAGYDFVKLHPGLTRAEFDAAAAAAREAGIPLAGHVSAEVGVARALEAGQATIDHLDGYVQYLLPPERWNPAEPAGFFGLTLIEGVEPERIVAAARATRDAGVAIVPTQVLIEQWALPMPSAEVLAARPEMRYVSPATVDEWKSGKARILGGESYSAARAERLVEVRRALLKALHEEGAMLLLGSDAPQVFNVPGFSIHRELEAMVAAGLTPAEALRIGTLNPARFFDAEAEFGQVRVGLSADLLLVGADPLADVAALEDLRGVMVRGRWLDRSALDAGLEAIAARQR